jgi:hypothetical protein
MGELLTAPGSRVPHHGPVTRDCPVECLLTVLSFHSFNPLTRAYARRSTGRARSAT